MTAFSPQDKTDLPDFPVFPADFRWGASTSAFQIEGALDEDDRGESIWDVFSNADGKIIDGSTAAIAADSYHRYPEDVALLDGLGVSDYRFSVAWPRVQPAGSGAVNLKGLDYYERLVDELLARDIAPIPTLFHWDLPTPVEDAGGWLSRDTAYRFADYAGLVADRLGDRVARWITLNEPAMTTLLGYATGRHAPGRALLFESLPTAHHQLLGHGLATSALRERGVREVGIANNHTLVVAASDSEPDRLAAEGYDMIYNRVFADPLLLGRYPDLTAFGFPEFPGLRPGDVDIIATPLDFYGVNSYNPTRIGAPAAGSEAAALGLPFDEVPFDATEVTGFGWPIKPAALTELLVKLTDRYPDVLPPIVITENGCSFPDRPENGRVEDTSRIGYLDGHIRAVHEALRRGADVRGYYVWSLLDNFEWAEGYTQRFGLYYVDFSTGERTAKASADWFRELIAASRQS
ncbi:GH1 family beta-glucosidase [Saxibacter everestensis]|uniref:Beta-glucosidase n=1 Tax=Saxibacter everestensis TaxID=2909229 RepID=A0ABY8QTY7_9MICO|nr:GH1 family beta-glucosidase [Brevibacteriaceae bacterium ZFBP1038]